MARYHSLGFVSVSFRVVSTRLVVQVCNTRRVVVLIYVRRSLHFFRRVPLRPISPMYAARGYQVRSYGVKGLFLVGVGVDSRVVFPIFEVFGGRRAHGEAVYYLYRSRGALFFCVFPSVFLVVECGPIQVLFVVLHSVRGDRGLVRVYRLYFSCSRRCLYEAVLVL